MKYKKGLSIRAYKGMWELRRRGAVEKKRGEAEGNALREAGLWKKMERVRRGAWVW